jgi:hypothetical protein
MRNLVRFGRLGLLGFALVAGLAAASPAQAANWLEMNFYLSGPRYDGVVPSCDYGLDTIASRFSEKEGTFWNSGLQIVGFDKVRETAFRPWANDTIPRRFCTATAHISDGSKHAVNYWIGEDTGFIGATWGVTWCVVGLDRDWSYNPKCKMARP